MAFKNKWGYINEMNETVIPFRYQWAYPFNDGIASVNDYGGNGHIDKMENGLIMKNINKIIIPIITMMQNVGMH